MFFKPGWCFLGFLFTPKALDTIGPLASFTSLEVAEFNLLPFESKAVLTSVRRGSCSVQLGTSVG